MKITVQRTCLFVLAVVLAVWLTGCGGGDDASNTLMGGGGDATAPATTGSLRVTVKWPERVSPQAIPEAAESIRVEVLVSDPYGDYVVSSATIVRPNNEADLRDVPTGEVTVCAYAYDGQEWWDANVLAVAETSVEVVEGDNDAVTLDLGPLPEHPTSTFLPLAIGNQWTYQYSESGGVPPEPAPYTIESRRGGLIHSAQANSELVLTITRNEMCWGELWFEAIISQDGEGTDQMYFLHNATGLRTEEWLGTYDEYYLIQNPLEVGTNWVSPGGYATRTIVGVDETVTVPAGTFTGCLLVEEQEEGYDGVGKDWFAPGVGLVKQEWYYNDVLADGMELIDYQVASP